MSIQPRSPPPQFAFRLKRELGGKAGWSGVVLQAVFVLILIWVGYEVYVNASGNLETQHIATGFGFLSNNAGFDINQTLISYSGADTYFRVFLVGLLNTILVSLISIFFATVLGVTVALGRLSPNWLMSRVAGAYVEIVRNLPLLFQMLFWYLAVLAALPAPRQSVSLLGILFLNNRGLIIPRPIGEAGFDPFLIAALLAIGLSIGIHHYARRQLFLKGRVIRVWPYVLGLLIGLPLVTVLVFGVPFKIDLPELKGFNFAGGVRVVPELVALAIALSTYTAAFIAETVRSGILAVHKGQMEAGLSLGLSRGEVLRLIVMPQALRVILPPLTSQYLSLTKNSSLAVAIGYPDLVSVFAGTALNQTGQAIEIIAITLAVYLALSLFTSAVMNFYNWRVGRSLGA
jgi:general L-amino acid transport system permease protein